MGFAAWHSPEYTKPSRDANVASRSARPESSVPGVDGRKRENQLCYIEEANQADYWYGKSGHLENLQQKDAYGKADG